MPDKKPQILELKSCYWRGVYMIQTVMKIQMMVLVLLYVV